MDFDFTDDQASLRDAVQRWVDKGFTFERRHALAKAGGATRAVYGELAELGLTGLAVPEANGGMGFGAIEAMDAGWQGDHVGAAHIAPLSAHYFNHRKTTIYGGSNEVQRNIVAQTVLG